MKKPAFLQKLQSLLPQVTAKRLFYAGAIILFLTFINIIPLFEIGVSIGFLLMVGAGCTMLVKKAIQWYKGDAKKKNDDMIEDNPFSSTEVPVSSNIRTETPHANQRSANEADASKLSPHPNIEELGPDNLHL